MRTTRLTFLCVLSIFLAATAYAQSPREQLAQWITQLQATPHDDALRQQVISAAVALNPAPTIPEEAQRHLGRGLAAFETAKGPDEFTSAVQEFQSAADAAPWWPDAYFNLATVQEKTGAFRAAMANYAFYLLAAPNASDADAIRTKRYKLEYLADQEDKASAVRAIEEAATSLRQAWASGIVAWLNANYGGRVTGVWIKPDWKADEKNGLRFQYSICGAGGDQIQLVDPWVGETYCGIPSGPDVTSVYWRGCGNTEGKKGSIFAFVTMSGNGRPAIKEYLSDIKNAEDEDSANQGLSYFVWELEP